MASAAQNLGPPDRSSRLTSIVVFLLLPLPALVVGPTLAAQCDPANAERNSKCQDGHSCVWRVRMHDAKHTSWETWCFESSQRAMGFGSHWAWLSERVGQPVNIDAVFCDACGSPSPAQIGESVVAEARGEWLGLVRDQLREAFGRDSVGLGVSSLLARVASAIPRAALDLRQRLEDLDRRISAYTDGDRAELYRALDAARDQAAVLACDAGSTHAPGGSALSSAFDEGARDARGPVSVGPTIDGREDLLRGIRVAVRLGDDGLAHLLFSSSLPADSKFAVKSPFFEEQVVSVPANGAQVVVAELHGLTANLCAGGGAYNPHLGAWTSPAGCAIEITAARCPAGTRPLPSGLCEPVCPPGMVGTIEHDGVICRCKPPLSWDDRTRSCLNPESCPSGMLTIVEPAGTVCRCPPQKQWVGRTSSCETIRSPVRQIPLPLGPCAAGGPCINTEITTRPANGY